MTPPEASETAILGGGCFWCLDAVFAQLVGVAKVESGYTGGNVANPTYEAVCSDTTGHAEVVRVTFDPAQISYREILEIFFAIHDPTTLNRQGNDRGTQYRSAIYTGSQQQQAIAEQLVGELDSVKVWGAPVVTEIAPAGVFYRAEEYHQDYYSNNPQQPYCRAVVAPKLAKAREKFAAKLKK